MKTNTKTILLFIMSFALIGFISFTYAYFSNDIVNSNVKDQVVETGTLSLRYVDGPEINMQNIKPGSTITKTVYVANTGTLDASYNLVWQELVNEITNDEMVIEAKCTRMDATTESESGSCNNITTKPIKDENIRKNITIEPSIVHKYDITITFKETNEAQNYNQGKKFSGVLGVNEYKAPDPVYCTFEGDMVQGAEYVNGQYTYRYMQEGEVEIDYKLQQTLYKWNNVENDGWGVVLTDKTSSDPVTSKLCTYINDKPIVSMSYMFYSNSSETIDLSSFNTSNVTNMSYMFAYTSELENFDLNSFDTSKVTNMSYMFYDSSAETLDLSNFDTSNVTNMSGTFYGSGASVIDFNGFDTSNVTDMSKMFYNNHALTLDLSGFDTSNVTNMNNMFSHCNATTLDLKNFDTSKVTNMSDMFQSSQAATLNLSSFDTSNVTNMSGMFSNTQMSLLDLSNFDTSNVTTMSNMFYGNKAEIIGLNNFDTSKVTNMSHMFRDSKVGTLDLLNFDTSNVTDMSWMFYGSNVKVLDLSSFDTSKVTNINYMFYGCGLLKTIYVSDKFVTTSVTSIYEPFLGCYKLVGGAGTKYDKANANNTYARIDGGTSSPGYFTLKTN